MAIQPQDRRLGDGGSFARRTAIGGLSDGHCDTAAWCRPDPPFRSWRSIRLGGVPQDDAVVAQASVMWLLHRGLAVVQDCGESLEQQIVRFSTAVFDAIRTSYPMLRKAEHERLWLIYFKGLLTANTHPHEEMVSALRNIAYRSGFGLPPLAKGPGETAKPIPGRASDDDANALKQIARGLAENNSSFEM
jgi:hypothetical protein